MKKTTIFICFEMLKEGQKFLKLFFLFSSKKQGNKYVQNILFAPIIIFLTQYFQGKKMI
jgi:hypothetical protein